MPEFDRPWVEKYRPQRLDEVVNQDEVVQRLKIYVQKKSMPHLLFAGPPGTGKTTCALALARELYGDAWRDNFLELNASDERGIDVIRHKVKDFARTRPIGDVPFKIVFLDESDALTADAQNALRRTMEMFTQTCRFILSCNYSSKIIPPIQSRCAIFRFRPLRDEDIAARLKFIAEQEGVQLTDDGLRAIIYVAAGDMRKAINVLQAAASAAEIVNDETVYQITSTARPEKVREMLELALRGQFEKARSILHELMVTYGLAGEDIIQQIHREVFNLNIPDDKKIELVDKVGEYEFRLVEGSHPVIQLEALLAHFTLIGRTIR